jgi:hypothetical protein
MLCNCAEPHSHGSLAVVQLGTEAFTFMLVEA